MDGERRCIWNFGNDGCDNIVMAIEAIWEWGPEVRSLILRLLNRFLLKKKEKR